MKAVSRWIAGIAGGLGLLGIVAPIVHQPLLHQRTAEAQAAHSAVQAALLYASRHEDRLPESLNPAQIRRAVPEGYDGDIPAEAVIYLPPKDKRLDNTKPDTVLVIVPVEGGAFVGYTGGHTSFVRSGTNVRISP